MNFVLSISILGACVLAKASGNETTQCTDGPDCKNDTPSSTLSYPNCGKNVPNQPSNIINGLNVKSNNYPWHVGVYNAEKDFICNGVIVNKRVILSAAHCFCDESGTVLPKENYLISAGNYYSSYNDLRDQTAQHVTIDAIHVPQLYRGEIIHYQNDIAVIILTKALDLTESVQPVCIDLLNEFEHLQLIPNSYGMISKWGFTGNGDDKRIAEELNELTVVYVPYHQCFENVPRNFRKYLTYDKICAVGLNSTNVCGGESGAGLVFPRQFDDRYFVRGILSIAPATRKGKCDPDQYRTYTSISKHLEFIKNIMTLNQE